MAILIIRFFIGYYIVAGLLAVFLMYLGLVTGSLSYVQSVGPAMFGLCLFWTALMLKQRKPFVRWWIIGMHSFIGLFVIPAYRAVRLMGMVYSNWDFFDFLSLLFWLSITTFLPMWTFTRSAVKAQLER